MQPFFKALILTCMVGTALAVPSLAEAQSSRDLQNRINRLETELETLSRAVYRGENPPEPFVSDKSASMQANMEVRLQQIETEMRDMRGQIEQQSFDLRQIKETLDRALADIELRFQDSNSGGASAPSFNASPSVAAGTAVFNRSGTPQAQGTLGTFRPGSAPVESVSNNGGVTPASLYEHAFALLKDADYDAAEVEFQRFLDNYPDHSLSANAFYWLGETHYVRGNFQRAAQLFAEGYQRYKDGPKTPDSLLKLGMSLAQMGNQEDACVALGQLMTEYQGSSGPVTRRAEQESRRIGCR